MKRERAKAKRRSGKAGRQIVVEIIRGPLDQDRVDAFIDLLLEIRRRTQAR